MGKRNAVLLAVLIASGAILLPHPLPASGVYEEDLSTVREEIFAMDTYMTVSATGRNAKEAVEDALEEIRTLDALWSISEKDSEVSRLNRHESVRLSPDTRSVLERALEISRDTGGAFDITIYPLMEEWGFPTGNYQIPSEKILKELLGRVGSDTLDLRTEDPYTLPSDRQIDLGGIAKGYTSDRIMEIFEAHQVAAGIVSLGGNVETFRTKADGSLWKVGIQNPDPDLEALSGADVIGIVETAGKAVVTSGGYERYFEKDGVRYHHILDPETGMPAAGGLISVSVVSTDGCLADALSTALFVMGKEDALSYWKERRDLFDMILVEEDGNITVTSGLKDCFTSDLPFETAEP